MMLTFFAVLAIVITAAKARSVLELQGVNFELATSYKYAAILFYDSSTIGQTLTEQWLLAAEGFDDSSDIHEDGEIAMVNDLMHLAKAYYLSVLVLTASDLSTLFADKRL